MTSQTTPKIRLVRCPRCKQVLPEPDIPVYKCGGCGAVLQAKNRKTDAKDTGLSGEGTAANKKEELDCVPDHNALSSLNEEATSSAGGESSPDTSNKRIQDDFPHFIGKQPSDENFSHELSNSPQLRSQENGDLSPRVRDRIEQAQSDYNSDQDKDGHENNLGDSKRNWSRGRSFSDDFYSSMEFPCHETEDSSPELQAKMALRESNTTSDHCCNAHEGCIGEQHEDTNFLSKVSSSIEDKLDENDFSPKGGALEERDESKCISQHVASSNECKFEGHSREFPKDVNSPLEISSSTVVVPEKPSLVAEANSEVEENLGGHVLGSLNTEDFLDKKETDSSDTDENPLDGTILLDNVDSPDGQQLGASQRMIPRGFRHASSEDTLDNLPLVNLSSEFDLENRHLSKSPTRMYYGNDGSASSYDGFENRGPGRFTKPPKRKLKHANFNNSSRLEKEDGPPSNDVLSSNFEMQDQAILGDGIKQAILGDGIKVQNQARKSSILPENNHPAMKYKTHQDDLHDPRCYGHSSGSRMREDKDEHVSQLPFIPKQSLTGYRRGNLSHYPYNVFQHYSGFSAPDAPSYAEPDKLELLRMVHELKDELNRMHISNSRSLPTVIREDKYTPLFYDRHPAPLEGISADLRYSRYPGRCSQGKGLPQFHRVPRVAFSGDAADYRRHVDCACLHCHPQDWQRSVQLPSHSICCNRVHHMAHSSTCYNGQCSTSSSPRHYKSSELSVYQEAESDDHWHIGNEKKLHLRERYHTAKRHLRPVAGGTPFVACYHCSELLQVPADFLLLGRRCHKLRCSACRKVMKFALRSSTHLVPHIVDAVAPPPSMVDDCSESIRQRNWASTSHSNDNPYAEPFSCTDDYGISFDRSCSTEGETSLITPHLHHVERNSINRNITSGNCVMPLGDRKMKSALEECQQTHMNSVEKLGSVEPLSKRSKWRKSSSIIRELPPSGGSPLHRLMGYSSPSAVMKN